MSHTVHLDRNGYVVEVFLNTKPASLDAQKYAGTLMEVLGDVCPGWRWDGQRFALPPPRIPAEAVIAERDRRINTHFPERLREQITSFGSANAIRMQRYIAEVQSTAEAMVLGDPPSDYRDDRRWPLVPTMEPMEVPARVHDVPTVSAAPISVHVVPVIHTSEAKPQALVVQHETLPVRQPDVVQVDEFGISRSDPLYDMKHRLVSAIEATVKDVIERSGHEISQSDLDTWQAELGRLAALATDAQTESEFLAQESRVEAFLKGAA
jgi:hypothetical protein